MYQYSRAIYMTVRDLVDPAPATISPTEARRRVLSACEQTIGRLMTDPLYFARPERSLFEQIRHYFPITAQARVLVAVERGVELARAVVETELEQRAELMGRCRATTRKGTPCRRAPLPDHDYCPSHRHLVVAA